MRKNHCNVLQFTWIILYKVRTRAYTIRAWQRSTLMPRITFSHGRRLRGPYLGTNHPNRDSKCAANSSVNAVRPMRVEHGAARMSRRVVGRRKVGVSGPARAIPSAHRAANGSAVVGHSRLSVRSNRVTRVAGGCLLSRSTCAWEKSEQRVIRASERRRTVRPALWQRRRNGSSIVSDGIRREVVRDEPRADYHVLPGHTEAVPKGEKCVLTTQLT